MVVCSRRAALRWTAGGALGLWSNPRLQASEPHVAVPAYNTLTDEQEIELGRHFAAMVEQESRIVSNPIIDGYLGRIVNRLARQSQRPNLPYSIKLVNSNDINAFSLAGGFLYVNRGLVQFVGREDELVATLAHEVGHVVARHATNQLLMAFAARRLLQTVLRNIGTNNGVIEGIVAQFGGAVAMLTLLHFGRQDETEADLLGFYEMLRAGWNPNGFLHLFNRLAQMEQQAPSRLNQYLSSHPSSAVRADIVEHELTEVSVPREAREDSVSFAAFHLALKLLPEPPKHDSPR